MPFLVGWNSSFGFLEGSWLMTASERRKQWKGEGRKGEGRREGAGGNSMTCISSPSHLTMPPLISSHLISSSISYLTLISPPYRFTHSLLSFLSFLLPPLLSPILSLYLISHMCNGSGGGHTLPPPLPLPAHHTHTF